MVLRSLTTLLLLSTCALADFSYQQTSRVTGGAMAGMMKVAGAFSAKAREPMVSTVMVKGNRFATVSRDSMHIVDIDRETITDVNLSQKTYSVMTFAEMAEFLKRLASKMGREEAAGAPEVNFKADVRETGQKKDFSGYPTRQFLVSLTVENQPENKSSKSGTMDMQMDMWLAPAIPGYDEIRQFHMRMAEKLSWSPMAAAAGPFAAQNRRGMAELAKQMSKLDGIPVLQIVRMGITGAAEADSPAEAEPQATQAQPAEAQRPAVNVADAIGGRAGRVIGGFGGFGRKKKTADEPPAPPPPAAQTRAPQQQQPSSTPGALMEITTESSAFSSASVDAAKFEVPAGFKKVDHELTKELR